MELDLVYRFQVSQATVSRIFNAWINFMYCKFSELPIWPSLIVLLFIVGADNNYN